MGSLSDIHNFGDYRRFRAWILAAATALIGAQLLHWTGVVRLEQSMYLAPRLNWVGNIAGGLIFGVGMVLGGGCPSRNLARAGGGDLRALLTMVVLGLFSYMTIAGLVAPVRATIENASALSLGFAPTQGIGDILAALTGISRRSINFLAVALVSVVGLVFCFGDRRFRTSPVHVLVGARGRRNGGCGMGGDRARLRRYGGAAGAARLAHLYPAARRHAAVAGPCSLQGRCRASA